jgi:hypothetical protein
MTASCRAPRERRTKMRKRWDGEIDEGTGETMEEHMREVQMMSRSYPTDRARAEGEFLLTCVRVYPAVAGYYVALGAPGSPAIAGATYELAAEAEQAARTARIALAKGYAAARAAIGAQ